MTGFFSAVNGKKGTKLGMKVEGICKKLDRPLVSMVTMLISYKLENAVMAKILGLGFLIFGCELMSVISMNLPKMSEIYLTVLELGPDNLGGNINQFSCMGGDVMLTVTRSMTSRARDVITRAASRAT